MKKFQKRPEIVDAIQWDGTKECETKIRQMTGPSVFADWRKINPPITVPTRSGEVVRGVVGGWVTKDPLGFLDYLTDEAMKLSYMLIDDEIDEIVRSPKSMDAKMTELTTQVDPVIDLDANTLDIPDDSFSQKEEVESD
jgi:hypothetical protein